MLTQPRDVNTFRHLVSTSVTKRCRFAFVGILLALLFLREGDGRVLYRISTITRISRSLHSKGASLS